MPVRRQRDDKVQPTRHYSKKQENQVASKFGGERTLNSGATPFSKGDVTTDKILIECKTKVKPSESMTIHKEWLEKNEKEALFMGKPYSALAFNFGPDQKNYYIIGEHLFEFLLRGVTENDNI